MLKMSSRLLGLPIGVACRIAAGAIHTRVWRSVTVAAGVRVLSPEWSKARPIAARPLGTASSPGTRPGK